jgi:polyhydroxyalkanoate synthesis regulator phasin
MPKKAKIPEIVEIEEMEEERSKLFELARKVALAAVGAAALAQDELEDFVNRLVERGEIAEKDARKLIREVSDKRRKKVEGELDKRLESLLDQLDIPSKADIDELSAKITTLTHKVEALKKGQA